MRVAFDHQIFSLQTYGGISRYFVRLAEQLSTLQQEAKVFAPVYCNKYLESLTPSLRYGWHVSSKWSKLIRLALPLNHLVCKNKMEAWKPDITHETYFSMFGTARPKCPTVITVYDMVHELFPDEFSRISKLANYKRKAVNRADHVICISESTRRDLLTRFDIPEEKVSVVHLGFDKGLYKSGLPEQHTTKNGTKPFLLFVGNRHGYKNFSALLKAVSFSSRLKLDFDIVAFGGDAFTSAEYLLMETLGLGPQQVRQVSGDDAVLDTLYNNARALVYPSLYEGFGLPPLEAMAHNCPVIVSNTSAIPEVVGNAGEYFDPSSPESIMAAIERVVYCDETTCFLTGNGQQRLKGFSWEACAENTLAIYKKLTD